FIVFLREIFGTILNGLPVVFADDEESVNPLKLIKLFEKTGADGFGSTPTRLLEYLELEEIRNVLSKCKIIIVGGEAFPPILYNNLSKYTDALIYNSYGPTEVTIASHYKLMDSPTVTAGWPMLNVVDKIMDIDGNQLPDYVTGEIYVGGAGIARGYLNNRQQTDKVFSTINNIPYYNTGDLGKKDCYGELYVQGRNDTQIKLRGLRIELSEIETAISKYENIILSKVMVKEVNDIEHLCAYYTASEEISKNDLVEYLSQILPDYMIPSYYTQLETFPKTPNGKINFKKLPEPVADDEKIVLPRNELEEEIHTIISGIIGTEKFGINTNLFKMGLTSLNAVKLISQLHNKLNIELNVTDIIKYKNIGEIASKITYAEKTEHEKLEYYPLTPNQLGVYFDCMKNPESLAYNLPKMIRFSHEIDSDKLKSSIITSINNHPYLKTQIVMKEGNVYQKRDDNANIDDLIRITEEENINAFVRPFKLDEEKLFRFEIVQNRMLLADFHHLIVDGVSLNILFDEIARIYDEKEYILEEMDGYEYVLNEHETELSDKFTESGKFFENKIENFEEATVISQDINGDEDRGNVKVKELLIDKNVIDDYCQKNNISQNNLFLSVFSLVLSKFVYNKNLLIATITNGRFNPNQEKTIAMMVKTLPLALELNSEHTINEYYDYINSQWLDVLANSSYPLTRISDDMDITPEILFAYHGKIIEDIHMDGMTLKREAIGDSGVKFKITLNVEEENDNYNINCEYNDQLYSEEYINTLLKSIRIVLEKFRRFDEKTQLKNISITKEDNWMEDDLEFIDIGEKRVNRIFESCVEEHGEDIALYACDGRYTFNQLNIKANRIANALIKLGVKVEDKVMIILKRNSNFIASMLGILKAGAAFIPIDSDYPKDRIEHVLTDSRSRYIITDEIIDIKNLDLSEYNEHLLNVNKLLEEENTCNPNTDVTESNLAYLIYTSGSTGLPKGVMLEHQNLANFTYPHPDNVYTYELANYKKEDYRVLSTITVAFDVFIEETMCSLLNGVPIVLADDNTYKDPRATMELVKKYKANVYTATPSRILQYLQIGQIREDMLKFKVYAIAGEPFPNRLYEDLSKNTDAHIFNVYGPTETTISCNTALLTNNNITVGKELFNVKEQIMDLDSNPLPPNVIGELYIAGLGVSRAYLNRPENNAKSYTTINNIRYYKSGDLAKRGSDGQIYVYGRLDNQIKLRGLRIEIGEIELAISRHEAIKDVAVVVKNINDNDYLCAYYTVYDEYRNDEGHSVDIDSLKEKLEESLVYYMIPTFFTELEEFPRTPNDKVDLKNLPEPETDTGNYKNPSNEIEEKLWKILSEILDFTTFGVDTDLFSIGLTSLTMMQVVSEIYEEFNTQLMITQVMKNKTIEKIAELIEENYIEEYDTQQLYPLTPNQLGVYFECVKKPEDLSYNMPIKMEFGKEIDPYRLKSSIIEAINNHPYLKTRIIMDDGEVFQERRDNFVVDDYIEIINEAADEESFVQPFILDEGPLFRFKIFEDTTLLADFHHIIIDGTSLNIL
ncbi:non-ribosomal peptide synthetase, partial [Methanosphaera sp.]|uniref:non-ribosomal peptide synthetase n=1 Tax=Methanosphaera sp. TaxID=2666342 RepID=UPI002E76803E